MEWLAVAANDDRMQRMRWWLQVHSEGGDSVVDWVRGAADGVWCGATALWEAVARPGETSLAGGGEAACV